MDFIATQNIIWILLVRHFLYAMKHAIGSVDLMPFIQKNVNHMVKPMETNWETWTGLFQKLKSTLMDLKR